MLRGSPGDRAWAAVDSDPGQGIVLVQGGIHRDASRTFHAAAAPSAVALRPAPSSSKVTVVRTRHLGIVRRVRMPAGLTPKHDGQEGEEADPAGRQCKQNPRHRG